MIDLKYEVVTTPMPNGMIEQSVKFPWMDIRQEIMTTVLNAQEDGIRQALIQLGWAPGDKRGDPAAMLKPFIVFPAEPPMLRMLAEPCQGPSRQERP